MQKTIIEMSKVVSETTSLGQTQCLLRSKEQMQFHRAGHSTTDG